MTKRCMLLLAAALCLILVGCDNFSGESAGKIIPPQNQVYPLEGKWTVIQELETASQNWIGSDVQFAEGNILFGGHVWNDLTYKIKRVKTNDYLTSKDIPLSVLSAMESRESDLSAMESRESDVITVYAASNFLGEIMKLDDSKMIFFVQNEELILEKVSDQADSMLGTDNANAQDLIVNRDQGDSGVLLGTRIPSGEGFVYRTLWIAADRQQLHPVLAANQIFFPRTSGFWELRVEDNSDRDHAGNLLTARNLASKALAAGTGEGPAGKQQEENMAVHVIDYIGNDYAAIEKNTSGLSRLLVLPVDNLSASKGMNASDLLGKTGFTAYLNARDQVTKELKENGISMIPNNLYNEDFGLSRENGHWCLFGRINYESNGIFQQRDFALKSIPPNSLIFYDTLALSWHSIKDRVPDATDAFTSPNKDIALVRTKNKLTVYRIGAEKLSDDPMAELNLQEGETIIMAEWATGSYVDSWEKSFLAYGAQNLPDGQVRIHSSQEIPVN